MIQKRKIHTMKVEEAILKRRSIRKYKDTPVSQELTEKLLTAADSAPSACNRHPLKFYSVTDRQILEKLNHSGRFTNIKAPLAIVVVGDLSRALPRSFGEYWIQDAAAASENILLMATSLELGSLWCGAYPQRDVMKSISEALGLPDSEIPFSLIKIGYPDEEPTPHGDYNPERVSFID